MNAFPAGNVTFYDAVNVVNDIITKVNPFPYAAKFISVICVTNVNKSDV